MRLSFDFGQGTDPGRVRESNEDSICVLKPPELTSEFDALLVVADGMGGHNAGEVASRYVTDKFQELFASPAYREWVPFDPVREDYNVLVLKEVIERLNNDLYQQSTRHEEYRGMGTTATVALIAGARLFLGHVGDSRAYLLSGGELHQLTTDHSWVMEQVEQGLMTPEQAAADPRKNQITRALGVSSMLKVERRIVELQPGDTLLLCTDGLTNMVSDAELKHYLQTILDANAVCKALIDAANQRGGGDNITVAIARIGNGVVAPPLVAHVEPEQKTDRIVLGSKNAAQPKRRGVRIRLTSAPAAPKPTQAKSPVPPVAARVQNESAPTAQAENLEDAAATAPAEDDKPQTKTRLAGIVITAIAMGWAVFTALVNLGIVYAYIALYNGVGNNDWWLGIIIGATTLVFISVSILLTAGWFSRSNKPE